MNTTSTQTRANRCPHCDAAPCLPLWRKMVLGPGASARCGTCGLRVGVDVPRAILAMLPTFLLVVVTAFGILTDPVALVVMLFLSLAVMFAAYAVWVPLVVGEISNARMVEAGRARLAK